MKTVLAAAALSLCLAFASHAAELRPIRAQSVQATDCIPHGLVRIGDTASGRGCAQFLSTSRVVQGRTLQHG